MSSGGAIIKRIPTLDGWRAIAIILVLIDHAQLVFLHGYPFTWTRTGQHGVTIFFVLSGFLISTRLLENPIPLRKFYVQRFFRLMPAVWTYLIVIFLLGRAFHYQTIPPGDLFSSLFFYRNFVDGGWYTSHLWSLSIEEQFYLAWPCILLYAGTRRRLGIAVAGVICIATYRSIFYSYYNHELVFRQTQVRADALLVGCILALVIKDQRVARFIQEMPWALSLPSAAILAFCMARYPLLPPLVESIAIAVLLALTSSHPKAVLSRILCLEPLTFVGTVSYGHYLWQELFFGFFTSAAPFILGVVLPFCVVASYFFIERPFIRIGHRLTASQVK